MSDDRSVDAYFERLQAAIASLQRSDTREPEMSDDPPSPRAAAAVPTVDGVLGAGGTMPGSRPTGAAAEPGLSEEVVEELTRRVMARLAPEAVGVVIARVVAAVTRQMIREEIGRLGEK